MLSLIFGNDILDLMICWQYKGSVYKNLKHCSIHKKNGQVEKYIHRLRGQRHESPRQEREN